MRDESFWEYLIRFFSQYGGDIWKGTLNTLWLVPTSLLIGLCLAIPLGMLMASRLSFVLRLPALSFSYIFRGTPMLIQLYLIYFALGLWISEITNLSQFMQDLLRNKMFWAILTLALNTAAYTSEIVRGAIETAPLGEIEAAKSFGMSKAQIARRIILPGALRRALPAYSNEVIFMLHGSAIVSTIAIMDLTQAVRSAYGKTYEPYLAFTTAAVIYLLITLCIFVLFKLLEKRIYRHLQPIQERGRK